MRKFFLFQPLAKVCFLSIKFDALALITKKMPAALPTVTVQNGNGASVALPEVFTSPIRPYVSSEIVFFMVASFRAVICCVNDALVFFVGFSIYAENFANERSLKR